MTAPENAKDKLASLFDQLQRGDPVDWEDVAKTIRTLAKSYASIALRKRPGVHRWEATDDIVQEILVKMVISDFLTPEKLRAFESANHLSSYISKMVSNKVIDLLRHWQGPQGFARHYESPHSSPDESGHPQSFLDPKQDSTDGPARFVEAADFLERVQAALKQMDKKDAYAFEQVTMWGCSPAQVAQETSCDPRTVKHRMRRARLQLAKLFQQEI
jgi:RNA polymerase sigma factor (sigma-70 family)